MIVRTASWALETTSIMGPDTVRYVEVPTVGLRLDKRPQRQGATSMEWHYSAMPISEFEQIYALWEANMQSIAVTWLNPNGDWVSSTWHMLQPEIARRETFYLYDITIRFVAVFYTGSGLPITTGQTPTIYTGWGEVNKPPTAKIDYTVAIIGDPEIVISLDGRGSSDPDGIIMGYAWTDNSAAFLATPNYPTFTTPHEASTATTEFRYQYMAGMPNPIVTLSVTDNAGLVGTATITVDIVSLVAASPTSGKRFIVAAGGSAYYSLDGGFSFLEITGISGVTAVCGAGGCIMVGCDNGEIYRCPNDQPSTSTLIYTMTGSVVDMACARQTPSCVTAVSADGSVITSNDAGLTFSDLGTPDTGLLDVSYNLDASADVGISGSSVQHTRNLGALWEQDTSGLPGGSWACVQRTSRLRYAAGSPGLFVASGSGWTTISGVTGNLTALSEPGSTDKNVVVVGDDSGKLWLVTETTVTRSLTHNSAIRSCFRDPTTDSLVLIGTATGLYKTMDGLQSIGLMAFEGLDVLRMDVMREGTPFGLGELIVCGGGGLGIGGVWHYVANGSSPAAWVYKSTGLPVGWSWFQITADPYDKKKWALLGNTEGNNLNCTYDSTNVYAKGTTKSPVWMTLDAGMTWNPVPITGLPPVATAFPTDRDRLGGQAPWVGVSLASLAFDRTANRKLFLFGKGDTHDVNCHGIAWSGSTSLQYLPFTSESTDFKLDCYSSWPSASSDLSSIVIGEGGPDGGLVFLGQRGWSPSYHLDFTTSAHKISRNPGQAVLSSYHAAHLERRPTFSAYEVLLGLYTTGNILLYATTHYKTSELSLYHTIQRTFPTQNHYPEPRFFMTWAKEASADTLYCGAGMGVVSLVNPLTSTEFTTYHAETYFTTVRCDRQWRKVVAALAPLARTIHVKWMGQTEWSTTPLSYPHANLPFDIGLEVLGG